MRAELFCQRGFVLATRDRNRAIAGLRCELDREMAEATDAVDGDDISRAGAAVTQPGA